MRFNGTCVFNFLLVVVGIRLEFEIDSKFMDMLSDVCSKGCHVVFAGIMDNYGRLMEEYPVVSANSSFTGYCDDILALMEICDLYVNPDRLGGGFSVIEVLTPLHDKCLHAILYLCAISIKEFFVFWIIVLMRWQIRL